MMTLEQTICLISGILIGASALLLLQAAAAAARRARRRAFQSRLERAGTQLHIHRAP
jgi:hypothetical protein